MQHAAGFAALKAKNASKTRQPRPNVLGTPRERIPNLGEAAEALGIDQATLYRKRKKLGLD